MSVVLSVTLAYRRRQSISLPGYRVDAVLDCSDDVKECEVAGQCHSGKCTEMVGGFSCDCSGTGTGLVCMGYWESCPLSLSLSLSVSFCH